MRKISEAFVEAGLLDEAALQTFQRWGVPIQARPLEETILKSEEAVLQHLREALEGEDAVQIRETDLDLLSRFVDRKQCKSGTLKYFDEALGKARTLRLNFCLTVLGAYALAWSEENPLPEVLLDERTELTWVEAEAKKKVFLRFDHEVFLGGKLAFVICEERHG